MDFYIAEGSAMLCISDQVKKSVLLPFWWRWGLPHGCLTNVRGTSGALHSSSPLDLSLDVVGESPKQGVKVTEKLYAGFQAFSQVLYSWLLAGLQIFQLFDWIYYFFTLFSSLWVDILARWSQAGTDYLASLCSLIVLLIQKSSCRLAALLF